MIQAPKNVKPEIVPPREYIFIVDVSGSMHGFPLDVSKKLMKDLLGGLKQGDMFNILLFAGGSQLYSEKSVNASEENISQAMNFIDKQSGGGGTELLPALKRGMSLNSTEGISRSFVIVTDGYVSVEKKAFEYISDNLGKANFFPFGIGSSVNRHLIEVMAHVGQGEAFVVTNEKEAFAIAEKFRKYVSQPVLTNIELSFIGFETYDIQPANTPDVFAERPIIVFGKWKGKAAGSIKLTGYTGENRYSKIIKVEETKPEESNLALKYLWAREKVRLLDDFINVSYSHEELKEEVTSIGLKYNLLTQYTSFIALDSEIRNSSGNYTSVKQPLPLPQGVSNYAVGGVYSRTSRKSGYAPGKSSNNVVYELNNVTADSELEEQAIFVVIEEMPEFIGGMKALESFLRKNLRNVREGLNGFVYVEFIVDEDGSVKEIKIIRGLDAKANEEAIRLIRLTDKMWNPGKINGKAAAVKIMVPVKF